MKIVSVMQVNIRLKYYVSNIKAEHMNHHDSIYYKKFVEKRNAGNHQHQVEVLLIKNADISKIHAIFQMH